MCCGGQLLPEAARYNITGGLPLHSAVLGGDPKGQSREWKFKGRKKSKASPGDKADQGPRLRAWA